MPVDPRDLAITRKMPDEVYDFRLRRGLRYRINPKDRDAANAMAATIRARRLSPSPMMQALGRATRLSRRRLGLEGLETGKQPFDRKIIPPQP